MPHPRSPRRYLKNNGQRQEQRQQKKFVPSTTSRAASRCLRMHSFTPTDPGNDRTVGCSTSRKLYPACRWLRCTLSAVAETSTGEARFLGCADNLVQGWGWYKALRCYWHRWTKCELIFPTWHGELVAFLTLKSLATETSSSVHQSDFVLHNNQRKNLRTSLSQLVRVTTRSNLHGMHLSWQGC